ncbi:hypothetical protein ACS0TY_002409 [Phlomoides rotata]
MDMSKFDEFITNSNLTEIQMSGKKYTWYHPDGWTGFGLKEKLKALKLDTKNWSRNQKGDKDLAIAQYTEEIQKIDAIDDTLGLDEAESSNRAILMEQLATVMNQREAELIQKSKVRLWDQGEWVDSVHDVKKTIFSFFENHYRETDVSRPKMPQTFFNRAINQEANEALTTNFTEEELKSAIWDCDSNASPGPDGFSFAFFKKF